MVEADPLLGQDDGRALLVEPRLKAEAAVVGAGLGQGLLERGDHFVELARGGVEFGDDGNGHGGSFG